MTKKEIEKIISDKLLESPKKMQIGFFKNKYKNGRRYYHNWKHILNLVEIAYNDNRLSVDMLLAILFHDIVYDSTRNDNEEKSVEMFKYQYGRYFNDDKISNAILSTKYHITDSKYPFNDYLNKIDMSVLYCDFKTFTEYEMNIRKEFNHIDFNTYKENRLVFLKSVEPNINPLYLEYINNLKM